MVLTDGLTVTVASIEKGRETQYSAEQHGKNASSNETIYLYKIEDKCTAFFEQYRRFKPVSASVPRNLKKVSFVHYFNFDFFVSSFFIPVS